MIVDVARRVRTTTCSMNLGTLARWYQNHPIPFDTSTPTCPLPGSRFHPRASPCWWVSGGTAAASPVPERILSPSPNRDVVRPHALFRKGKSAVANPLPPESMLARTSAIGFRGPWFRQLTSLSAFHAPGSTLPILEISGWRSDRLSRLRRWLCRSRCRAARSDASCAPASADPFQ